MWSLNPAIAIHLSERFKLAVVRNEVTKLVRSNTVDVLDVPESLPFLLGDKLDPNVSRDLKVSSSSWVEPKLTSQQLLLVWAPVPPVIATTFFERRYSNDPLLLQYAHRVMEQHPIELTFFFVPQVVQALRYDDLGLLYTVCSFIEQLTALQVMSLVSSMKRLKFPHISVIKSYGTWKPIVTKTRLEML